MSQTSAIVRPGRVIDLHVGPHTKPDLEGITASGSAAFAEAAVHWARTFDRTATVAGVMVAINPGLIDEPAFPAALAAAGRTDRLLFAWTPDFRGISAVEKLEAAHRLGIQILKFHPYMHRMEDRDHDDAVKLARHADLLNMPIMICCSHGTRVLDRISGVRLAARLASEVQVPIILSHAGGSRILDAMLLAADAPNVYLETSFSLPYFAGSSIEQDFAFAMRKLGTGRWMYGSDAPYVDPEVSLNSHLQFFARYGFTAEEVSNVMYNTAARVLHDLLPIHLRRPTGTLTP